MVGEKSPVVAALLGFFCGGIGLFYVSVAQGLLALGVTIVASIITLGYATPVIWIVCPIWGYFAAVNHNERLRALSGTGASGIDTLGSFGDADRGGMARGTGLTGTSSGDDYYGSGGRVVRGSSETPAWERPDSSNQPPPPGCGSCGAPLQSGGRYCVRCGKSV